MYFKGVYIKIRFNHNLQSKLIIKFTTKKKKCGYRRCNQLLMISFQKNLDVYRL